MARNSSGTHSLPAGNPVVSGSTISSTTHNNTMSDFSSEITDSLSRSGKGAMTAPLELADGSAATPALSFDTDTDSGMWRKGANNIALGVNGAEVLDLQTTGVDVTGALSVSTTLGVTGVTSIANGTVGTPGLNFTSDTDCGLYRIGANNVGVAVNGAKVLDVSTSGLGVTGTLTATGAATLSGGATIPVATRAGPTINVGWTTGDGVGGAEMNAAYGKEVNGEVCLAGAVKRTSAGSGSTPITLGAGFRPLGARQLVGVMYDASAAGFVTVRINCATNGDIQTGATMDQNDILYLDTIRFRAEQ